MRSNGIHAIYPSPALPSLHKSVGDSCNPHALFTVLFIWPLPREKRVSPLPWEKRGKFLENFFSDAETMRMEHCPRRVSSRSGWFYRILTPGGASLHHGYFYSLQSCGWLREELLCVGSEHEQASRNKIEVYN